MRARFNLAAISIEAGQLAEALDELDAGLHVARERGDRYFERVLLGQQWRRWSPSAAGMRRRGCPDVLAGEINVDAIGTAAYLVTVARPGAMTRCWPGALPWPTRCRTRSRWTSAAAPRWSWLGWPSSAATRREVQRVIDELLSWPALPAEYIDEAYTISVSAAIASGDTDAMSRRAASLAAVRPAQRHRLVRATRARLEAEAAHQAGDRDHARRAEAQAEALLREVGARPRLAQALLERARRRGEPEPLAEAREIFASLEASRWLERVDQEFGVRA